MLAVLPTIFLMPTASGNIKKKERDVSASVEIKEQITTLSEIKF
jgi:hypothetical protein